MKLIVTKFLPQLSHFIKSVLHQLQAFPEGYKVLKNLFLRSLKFMK